MLTFAVAVILAVATQLSAPEATPPDNSTVQTPQEDEQPTAEKPIREEPNSLAAPVTKTAARALGPVGPLGDGDGLAEAMQTLDETSEWLEKTIDTTTVSWGLWRLSSETATDAAEVITTASRQMRTSTEDMLEGRMAVEQWRDSLSTQDRTMRRQFTERFGADAEWHLIQLRGQVATRLSKRIHELYHPKNVKKKTKPETTKPEPPQTTPELR
mgnify:CR=1 FL=1